MTNSVMASRDVRDRHQSRARSHATTSDGGSIPSPRSGILRGQRDPVRWGSAARHRLGRPQVRHNLKIDARWFEAVRTGRKKAEVRRADRAFQVGDELLLYSHDRLQGLLVEITDILALNDVPGCDCRDFVALSVEVHRVISDSEAVELELEQGDFG